MSKISFSENEYTLPYVSNIDTSTARFLSRVTYYICVPLLLCFFSYRARAGLAYYAIEVFIYIAWLSIFYTQFTIAKNEPKDQRLGSVIVVLFLAFILMMAKYFWIEDIDIDFSGKEITKLDIRSTDLPLKETILKDANFRGLDANELDLEGASLVGADLRGASLVDANLVDADLTEASLVGSNLKGAKLQGITINKGTNLDCALLIDVEIDDLTKLKVAANWANAIYSPEQVVTLNKSIKQKLDMNKNKKDCKETNPYLIDQTKLTDSSE